MRLRRLDIRHPPVINDRVDVVIEQEDMFAVPEHLQALVLGPGDTNVPGEPEVSLRHGFYTRVIHNNKPGSRREVLSDVFKCCLQGLRTIPRRNPDTDTRRRAPALRDIPDAIDNDVSHGPSRQLLESVAVFRGRLGFGVTFFVSGSVANL